METLDIFIGSDSSEFCAKNEKKLKNVINELKAQLVTGSKGVDRSEVEKLERDLVSARAELASLKESPELNGTPKKDIKKLTISKINEWIERKLYETDYTKQLKFPDGSFQYFEKVVKDINGKVIERCPDLSKPRYASKSRNPTSDEYEEFLSMNLDEKDMPIDLINELLKSKGIEVPPRNLSWKPPIVPVNKMTPVQCKVLFGNLNFSDKLNPTEAELKELFKSNNKFKQAEIIDCLKKNGVSIPIPNLAGPVRNKLEAPPGLGDLLSKRRPPPATLIGGYHSKYLKYKEKYLKLKNMIA